MSSRVPFGMELQFLGSGDAFQSGGRSNAAIQLTSEGKNALLDAGPGALGHLIRYGYEMRNLELIVITHFHGDHTLGLPQIALDIEYVSKPPSVPTVVGPPGLKQTLDMLMQAAYSRDFELPVKELEMEKSMSVGDWTVWGIPVEHTPESIGVRVTRKGVTVAYSGDTGWCENLAALSCDADLLVLECTNYELHQSLHVNYLTYEQRKSELSAKNVILTHLGSEMLDNLERVTERLASDGLKIKV